MVRRIETKNKYLNKNTVIDGIKFDSQGEGRRYIELKLMEKAGNISNLEIQKKFLLIPKQGNERPVTYIADFVYMEDGLKIVEDWKSPYSRTKDYIIKRKMMKFFHGITIKETGNK